MHLKFATTATPHPEPQAGPVLTARELRDGFEVFILRNAAVELALVPTLGAKVISLKNRRSGREWLWHPATGLKLFANEPGDDFSRSTLVGWDECLPTIAPCAWRERALPDHGEAWARPWQLDPVAWEAGTLKTSVQLPVSGLDFCRTLSLDGGRVKAEYRLENPTANAQEFVWAAHPLLAIQEGDRLELTDETRQHLKGEAWLESLGFPVGSAQCAKVYAGPLRQGRAGICNPRTGDRLTFEWNPAECDTLGLWLTRGGWNGHHHLALEPAIGAADSLAVAASQSKRCGLLPPHSTKIWRVQLHLES